METWEGLCVADYSVRDAEGSQLDLKRGKTYTLSPPMEQSSGTIVIVFSRYWCPVPAELFI